MGTVLPLADMHVGGNADYEHVGLTLCIQQVTQVTRVDHVEHAMAHDDLFRARARADDPLQLVGGLDLVPVFIGERWQHHQRSGLRYWNQVFVALSIDSGSQSGDRKSTRLNSSHSQISYAVFCLKKKKKCRKKKKSTSKQSKT